MYPAERNEPQDISGLIFCYIFPEEKARNIRTFFITQSSFIQDIIVKTQNIVSPLATDTTALIFSLSSLFKQSRHDQNADLGQVTYVKIWNIIVITTKLHSYQGSWPVFKDHFLNHGIFSSFDFCVLKTNHSYQMTPQKEHTYFSLKVLKTFSH